MTGAVRDLWDRIRRTPAEDWHFEHIPPERAPADGAHHVVGAEGGYVSAHLTAMRLSEVRIGTKRLYASVTSLFTADTLAGTRAEFLTVSTPEMLRDADAANLDRVVVAGKRLLGPIPYRGGDISAEIGLFAVPSADLLDPYLDLVEQVSTFAGVSFVPAAKSLVPTAKAALDAIFGSSASPSLEIGVAKNFSTVTTGYYCVVRIPRSGAAPAGLRVAADGRLERADGSEVTEPYLVFQISADTRRDDWAMIPDLQSGYERIRQAARFGDLRLANAEMAVFERAAIFSPDLLPEDGRRIADAVRSRIQLAFPQTATARTDPHTDVMPAFADLAVAF
ncbi:hypothetical protein AB0C07_26200 [Actinoplanes missouriensis]|uniref:hypothetical protein n=1 Tax=Actinoplanes missouriensis TaxID=1866 RepID=UPI0033C0368A